MMGMYRLVSGNIGTRTFRWGSLGLKFVCKETTTLLYNSNIYPTIL